MRSFILLAATAALITAGVDGCSRRPRPLRPHKEPHVQMLGAIGRPLAQNAGYDASLAVEPRPER